VIFLPIVERELRVAARKTSTFRMRAVVAALTSLVAVFVLLLNGSGSALGSGGVLFNVLSRLAFFFCLWEGTRSAADCVSEEKREGTLGFLFLTDLRGYDVILGKLAAISIKAFQSLFAFLPILAVALILGGVTMGEFWRTALVLVSTLFFSLCLGMLVSSMSRELHRALGATLLVLTLMIVAPYLIRELFGLGASSSISFLSPQYAHSLASDAAYPWNTGRFWLAVMVLHLDGWVFLFLASVTIRWAWQDKPASAGFWGGKERASRRRFGNAVQRARLRRLLLDNNPILWLAGRNDRQRALIWVLVAIGGGVGVSVWVLDGSSGSFTPGLSIGLVFVLTLVLNLGGAPPPPATLAEARGNGAIELLLATPLTVDEIIRGQRLALLRFFLYPVLTIQAVRILTNATEIWLQNVSGPATAWQLVLAAGMTLYEVIKIGVDFLAIGWTGMLMGMTQKKPAQAFIQTLFLTVLLPILLFCVPNLLIDWVLINWAKTRLRREFRKLASERFGFESEKSPPRRRLPKRPPPAILRPISGT
jgi:hypothetical protein